MRVDAYTKGVLTGILACLVWLCLVLTPLGAPVSAQPGDSVFIAGFVMDGQRYQLNTTSGVPVSVTSTAGTPATPVPTFTPPAPQPLGGSATPSAPAVTTPGAVSPPLEPTGARRQ
jgi:hypothetical protein